MGLWTMLIRKMAKNKWLQLNLWLGLTLCVALLCSMPLYSDAILHRTLQKELQLIQSQQAVYPGYIRVATTVSPGKTNDKTHETIAKADRFIRSLPKRFGLEGQASWHQRSTQKLKVYGADADEIEQQTQKVTGSFRGLTQLDTRVRLMDGRMPQERSDGVLEALVTQKYLLAVKRQLGEELIAQSLEQDKSTIRVVPVGIMDTAPEADRLLPYVTADYSEGFLISIEQFEQVFTKDNAIRVAELEWRSALNYEQINMDNIEQFIATNKDVRRYFKSRLGVEEINIPAIETVSSYQGKQEKLNILILSLYSPVILMLAFYLYMAANLIVDRQKTEISVLRSRGASRLQIMCIYAVENIVLGLGALAAGPFLGVIFTRFLGASSGFLELVQRSSLQVNLTTEVYQVAGIAVSVALVLTLIPAFLATRGSIVSHKQQSSRLSGMSFWHKSGLDFILVGVSVYLLWQFQNRQMDLKRLGLDATNLQMDPLLFLVPALFALGSGLLLLRLYPWFIRLVYWAGRRFWPPSLYHTLIQISRSSGQYLTIKLFLIMAVSIGLFSANSARTINENMESKIQYANGADIMVTTRWQSDMPVINMQALLAQQGDSGSQSQARRPQYTEPSFEPFRKLDGVESVARVFKKEDARFQAVAEGVGGRTTLVGIDTLAFGETAWMKDSLLNHHMNSYLNLIAPNPQAVLISRSMAEEANLKTGDAVRVSWDGLEQSQFVVYGIIDYWPSWNPLPANHQSNDGKVVNPKLIVGHLKTIQNKLAIEPYDVWMKLEEGVSSQNIYEQLLSQDMKIISLKDTRQELIASKNDPFRLAINGVMTLGFIISMMICFFGFLLFWVLTLSGRTLQYGVLQAMGLPFRQIIGMLVSEQLLVSGAAVALGVVIGNWISRLFVPLFELSFSTAEQVPPFEIVYQLSDYIQLYSIVGVMLLVGLAILGYRLSRTRIASALKLGEE